MPLPFLLDRGGGVQGCEAGAHFSSRTPPIFKTKTPGSRSQAHHSGKTINSLARSNKSRAGKHATNGVDAAAVFSPVCSGGIQRGARLPSRTPPISKKKNHCSKQTKNPGQLALGYFSMHRLGVSPCRRRSHELNNSSLRRPTK
jgi:hypothetical protein